MSSHHGTSLFGFNHCCPGIVGFSEMRFEKLLQLAILYGSDPDNENQVAIGSYLLQRMSF